MIITNVTTEFELDMRGIVGDYCNHMGQETIIRQPRVDSAARDLFLRCRQREGQQLDYGIASLSIPTFVALARNQHIGGHKWRVKFTHGTCIARMKSYG